jgi:hypothetical protein
VCQGDLLGQDSDQCGQSRVKNEGSLPTSGVRSLPLLGRGEMRRTVVGEEELLQSRWPQRRIHSSGEGSW